MKHNRRNIQPILTALLLIELVMLASSCHKRCRCYHYDSRIIDYDKEEVEQYAEGSCPGMRYQGGIRYYSYCEWD